MDADIFLRQWNQATHRIVLTHYDVRPTHIDVLWSKEGAGTIYTRNEWEGNGPPEWSFVDGDLLFRGEVPVCDSYSIYEYAHVVATGPTRSTWPGRKAGGRGQP